jgi:hypothetical protein
VSRAGLVASVGLWLVVAPAGCACDPGEVPARDVGDRTRRDAAIDAPSLDAPGPDAPGPDAPGPDAFREPDDAPAPPLDGCVSDVSLAQAGRPCLDDTDCPPALSCLEGGSLSPGASCELLASGDCACPAGSTAASRVSSSGVVTVCAPSSCAPRPVDPSQIGRTCATLRDCPEWMICEGSACALPCSTQCSCPGTTRCESVVTGSGIASRCVP